MPAHLRYCDSQPRDMQYSDGNDGPRGILNPKIAGFSSGLHDK
jgi:hypothetical protein